MRAELLAAAIAYLIATVLALFAAWLALQLLGPVFAALDSVLDALDATGGLVR